MSSENIIIFVYGTLLSGFGNHRLISESGDSEFLGKDTITGDMFGNGVPIISLQGTGTIHGELYRITPSTLRKLDRLEGYHPEDPSTYGYNRTKVTTHLGVDTSVYAMHPSRAAEAGAWRDRIESGDFRLHREQHIGRMRNPW